MADIIGLIPKTIKLIVNKGENLQLYHPQKIIKHQPRKWRVLFHGVVEKMATADVVSDTGNPEWLCEITVTPKNAQDPISLLVTDSKGRHIGQVLIPLSEVPSQPVDCQPGSRPPLVLSNIHKSELESTKKNSYPKGFLYYWIWADEYWKADEMVKTKSKKSLSRSMHDLSSSTFNLFRRKKTETSQTDVRGRSATDIGFRASPLKINTLKKKLKQDSDTMSPVQSQTKSRSVTMPNSPVSKGEYSKNPFESNETTDLYNESGIKHGISHSNQPSDHTSVGSNGSPASGKTKHGLFFKFKYKKSTSSSDLSKIELEKEKTKVFSAQPHSVGKEEGHRLFEKKNDFSKSSFDIPLWLSGDIHTPDHHQTHNRSRRMNRPQSMLIRTFNETTFPNNYSDENNNHILKSNTLSRGVSLDVSSDIHITNKNHEDMSKRELIDLVIFLESQLKSTADRSKMVEVQSNKLFLEKKDLQEDLIIVKDELCRLKLRLLEAGDTKYLEKSDLKTRAEVLSDLALWRANSSF